MSQDPLNKLILEEKKLFVGIDLRVSLVLRVRDIPKINGHIQNPLLAYIVLEF